MYVGNSSCDVSMTFNDNILPVTDEVKDLAVIVDSHVSFAINTTKTVARAFTRTNLIHKYFTTRDVATLWRVFVAYVRPLLEYATCVWSPHRKNRVESVQRKFSKRLPGYMALSTIKVD